MRDVIRGSVRDHPEWDDMMSSRVIVTRDGGHKDDSKKPMMDLLDPSFLTAVAEVMTFGARKYAPNNWRLGIDTSRLYAALQRHLNAYWGGEETDPESGLSHLAHAGCCLQMLFWTAANMPERDTRWKP